MNRSKKQEKRIAIRINGRRKPMSGAKEWAKGDVENDLFLVDAKYTDKKSYSLKMDVLNKITDEAYSVNKEPLLWLEFSQQKTGYLKEWIIMPAYLIEKILRGEENDD